MNNPIGMCFPDFIGPCLWIAVLRKARTKNNRSRARMIFSVRPARRAALQQKSRQSNTFAA